MKTSHISKAEYIRVYIRFLYCVYLWGIPEYDEEKDNRVPLWIAAAVIWSFAQIERYCFHGTRAEVAIFSLGFYIHLILFSAFNDKSGFLVIINTILCLYCLFCYMIWYRYRTSDLSNLTLSGPYKVGFKRFKAEHGNTVLCFYPVNTKEI